MGFNIGKDGKFIQDSDALPFEEVYGAPKITANSSIGDFKKNPEVIKKSENVMDYLASRRDFTDNLIDPALALGTDDIAETMRDFSNRLGTKFVASQAMKDAPDDVKQDMMFLLDAWEKVSPQGAKEWTESIYDNVTDFVFNPETLASVGTVVLTGGSGSAATFTAKQAAKTAATKKLYDSLKVVSAAAVDNPKTAIGLYSGLYGAGDELLRQDLEISSDGREEYDMSDVAMVSAFSTAAGLGLYGAGSKIARKFRADQDTPLPESKAKVKEDADNFDNAKNLEQFDPDVDKKLFNVLKFDEDGTPLTVFDFDIDDAKTPIAKAINKFVDDVGGGERTRRSILSEIRNAANSEETLDGKRSAIKQIIFNKAAELTANFYGKTAGILTPIVGLSGTARQLQKKLHHEFGVEYQFREGQKEVVQKDLFEVQREVTGRFNERFRAILDDLSLSELNTRLAEDVNAALSKSVRSKKIIQHENFDEATNKAINKAAAEIKDLYKDMGVRLKKIGVIDKMIEGYVPRMWSRSKIEANQDKLASLFVEKAGMSANEARATIKGMLDLNNQIDAGSGSGYFFSAKRKLNEIADDADFEEFLNTDVMGTLHAYTHQAGKAIAKHRVLGVTNFNDFKRFYINRIKSEVEAKGEKFTPKMAANIEKLYRTTTGEGLNRYGKNAQNAADAYSLLNRVAYLGLATVSSLTEIMLNISRAGVRNSVKGLSEAMQLSHKRIAGDLHTKLQNQHGLTAAEAFSEMRNFSIYIDQEMNQLGDRLTGDALINETMQKASNKFFRVNMLDQWTKFVQNVSYRSGKNLIQQNIEKLSKYGDADLDRVGRAMAGELAELGVDYKKAVNWYKSGADVNDDFYKKEYLAGAARYTNSVILQPTAMAGNKPFLMANPKTSILFQLLSYPAAFSNTVLKGMAKSAIKAPMRSGLLRTLPAAALMTGMARYTNYLRSNGESERGKDLDEILYDSVARWGGNGLLIDSINRARTSAMYTGNAASYLTLPFGPIGSDAMSMYQQGLIPTVGNKVPLLSGTYFGKNILGDYAVKQYRRELHQKQEDVFGGLIPEFQRKPSPVGATKFAVGGLAKKTGSVAMDILMGKTKEAEELTDKFVDPVSKATGNLIKAEVIEKVARNIEGEANLLRTDGLITSDDFDTDALAEAFTVASIKRPDTSIEDIEGMSDVESAMKAFQKADAVSKFGAARRQIAEDENHRNALDTIQSLKEDVDPSSSLESVVRNETGELRSLYRLLKIDLTEAELDKAAKANYDENTIDNLHDFLVETLKTDSVFGNKVSDEGAERIARDAIFKIAAKGTVNFNKFKAPKLKPETQPTEILTGEKRDKAIEKFTKDSIDKEVQYRSIRTFTDSEFNVSYPFAREIGTHVGSKGVAENIKMRDMVFDIYEGNKAGNMYRNFKNRRPTQEAFDTRFSRLEKVAKAKDIKVSDSKLQAGYINVKKPLVYESETAVASWKPDEMLANPNALNELVVNIKNSGVTLTKGQVKRLRMLRVRALNLQTLPSETALETLERDLMKYELNIDFREALKSMGFDSIKYKNEVEHGFKGESEFSYILFDPNQFKSVDAYKFDADDPRQQFSIGSIATKIGKAFAPKKPSGLYSEAHKAAMQLEGSKPKPGQSFLNELQRKQVTPDELEWTGANERFGNNKPVSKEEVQQFFEESDFDFDVYTGRHVPDEIEAVDDMPTIVRENNEEGLFDEWLEENRPFEKEMLDDLLGSEDEGAWDNLFEELFDEWQATTGGVGDFTTVPFHLEYSFEGANTKNYREVVMTLKDKFKKVDTDFKDDHHPELKNQVAHIRLADVDQTDDSFNKTLLIDEVQSDAHQSRGKNKNYITKENEEELLSLKNEYQNKQSPDELENFEKIDELVDEIDELDDMIDDGLISEAEYNIKVKELRDEITRLNRFKKDKATVESLESLEDKIMELENLFGSKAPTLPLKKNRQWGALGLRQAMKIAAEEGYDQVALTTGRLQAKRNKKDLDSGEGKKFLEFYDETLIDIWKKEFADKYGVEIKMVKYNRGDETIELPTIEMTDKMRSDILKGLKMFAEGGFVSEAERVAKAEPKFESNKTTGRTISALRSNLQRKVA